jgi:ketosteroid isomerase-like protein
MAAGLVISPPRLQLSAWRHTTRRPEDPVSHARRIALSLVLASGIGGAPAGRALAQEGTERESLPSVALPPELDRVLRDSERAWRARDAAGLAALFTEDGFVLSGGRPPVRGRSAVQSRYTGSGGPLHLRAVAYAVDDTVGYIIGTYGGTPATIDEGKFVLALRRRPGARWLIAADMDNPSQPMRPRPASSAPATPPR